MQRRRGAPIRHSDANNRWTFFSVLFILVLFWIVCLVILVTEWPHPTSALATGTAGSRTNAAPWNEHELAKVSEKIAISTTPENLSRREGVIATADVRGNLGPPGVVIQSVPGSDWIRDRWQAASDMHGTAIAGAHWIQLDFGEQVVAESIVLDWEAAYSDTYRLEASLQPITNNSSPDSIWILFDSTDINQKKSIVVDNVGQSPGVKSKTPLHVIHTLHSLQSTRSFRYLRLYILKSAMGWGVSLWQFDVIGYRGEQSML